MGIQERRQREKEQRREEIIEAASQVFIKKGIEAATMDEIATMAELSKATLYMYFKNKEELFLAVLLIVMDAFSTCMEKSQNPRQTVQENIRALGRAYITFFEKYPAYFKLLNTLKPTDEIISDQYDISIEFTAVNSRIWTAVCSPIMQGIKQGIIRADVDPLEVGITLWMGSTGIINLMDSMRILSKHKGPCPVLPEGSMLSQVKNLNFSKMLDDLWEAVINHIVVSEAHV